MTTSPFLPSGSLVFDIGANKGFISQQFLEAGAQSVVAVEACHEIYQDLYKVPGIVPIHAAAWNKHTVIPVSYCPQDNGDWSSCVPDKWISAVPDARFNPPQWVPTVTLDGLISIFGIPHLIKLDVEGTELKVLTGLSTKVSCIMFEFNRAFPLDALAILAFLRSAMGYEKACFACANLDLQTVPTLPINDAAAEFAASNPEWGMFTVI